MRPACRSKIAVASRDSDVDPVGACVGMKGSRVQAVVQELRGEKIDIVPWDDDSGALRLQRALARRGRRASSSTRPNHAMELVVPDDQLSLAIGRHGQNVRLAAQLTGWKLDITSETKVAEEKEVAWASLSRIEGLSEFVVQTLYNHGFRRAQDVVEADDEFLASLPGFSADAVPRVKASAQGSREGRGRTRRTRCACARATVPACCSPSSAPPARRARRGKTDDERLAELEGVQPYVLERLKEAFVTSPEDLYYEDDVERLVNIAGFSPGKARQLKVNAAHAVNKLTNGMAPINEKPLSEPETRDAQQYDELERQSRRRRRAAAAAAPAEGEAAAVTSRKRTGGGKRPRGERRRALSHVRRLPHARPKEEMLRSRARPTAASASTCAPACRGAAHGRARRRLRARGGRRGRFDRAFDAPVLAQRRARRRVGGSIEVEPRRGRASGSARPRGRSRGCRARAGRGRATALVLPDDLSERPRG